MPPRVGFLPPPLLPSLSQMQWSQPLRMKAGIPPPASQPASASPAVLPNLRDVSTAAPGILRENLVFRGAAPSTLPPTTPESSSPSVFLRSVTRFLDLRSSDERAIDIPDTMDIVCGGGWAERTAAVPLLNRRRILVGMARTLPSAQVRGMAISGLVAPFSARRLIVENIDAGGLSNLNRILLEASGDAIVKAIRILTEEVRKEGKVYVYCSAGKDRTGLLVALLLGLVGVAEDSIVADYVRSAETWENGSYFLREDYSRRLKHTGLTPKTWLGAPADVMEGTLRYLQKTHGGAEAYLVRNGLTAKELDATREALLL